MPGVGVVAEIPYRLIRSNRRTTAIQILPGGDVVVRCPRWASGRDIRQVVESRKDWILAQLAHIPEAEKLTASQMEQLREDSKRVFSQKAALFAPLIGVSYGNVTVRFQSTRWGSCSGKGNLSFNGLLLLAPSEILDYVVVHELCHRKEMNHSAKFWALVQKIMPNYVNQRKWLKQNGRMLLARLPK